MIARLLLDYSPGVGNVLAWRVLIEPARFVMERRCYWVSNGGRNGRAASRRPLGFPARLANEHHVGAS
jgi:hypothetical protein